MSKKKIAVYWSASCGGCDVSLLDIESQVSDPAQAKCAMFYSITNCQEGLRGISFGNFLIKQVAVELQRELPQLRTFATLSPIPGFRQWHARELFVVRK